MHSTGFFVMYYVKLGISHLAAQRISVLFLQSSNLGYFLKWSDSFSTSLRLARLKTSNAGRNSLVCAEGTKHASLRKDNRRQVESYPEIRSRSERHKGASNRCVPSGPVPPVDSVKVDFFFVERKTRGRWRQRNS